MGKLMFITECSCIQVVDDFIVVGEPYWCKAHGETVVTQILGTMLYTFTVLDGC